MIGAQKGRHANMGLLKVTGERRLGNMWKLKVCIAQIHPTGYRILALGNVYLLFLALVEGRQPVLYSIDIRITVRQALTQDHVHQ
jgi:hypothetical protein